MSVSRTRFENWARSSGVCPDFNTVKLPVSKVEIYTNRYVNIAWESWQACETWQSWQACEASPYERERTLREATRLALIPITALVLSGECTSQASALSGEIKAAIMNAHIALLAALPPVGESGIKADAELLRLLEKARERIMTPEEKEEQRRSFAAGNLALHTGESYDIVRKRIDKTADEMDGKA